MQLLGSRPITHGTKDQGVTYLTLTDPDNKNKLEFIETTPGHPFFVAKPVDAQPRPAPEGHGDLSRNWVGAGHLKIGDTIKQADGTTGLVANVTTVQQTREMFNLTVSEAHTYYVGQDGWLVHNSGCGEIIYSALDGLGRPTGVTALSTRHFPAISSGTAPTGGSSHTGVMTPD